MLPLVWREWRVASRSRPYLTGRVAIVAAGLAAWAIYLANEQRLPAATVGADLLGLLAAGGALVGLLATAFSMASVIRREQKQHTLEVLAMTDIGLGPALMQKLIGEVSLLLASMAACLPLLFFAVSLGGVGAEGVLAALLVIALSVLLGAAIGMFAGVVAGRFVYLVTTLLALPFAMLDLYMANVSPYDRPDFLSDNCSVVTWGRLLASGDATLADLFAGLVAQLWPVVLLVTIAWWRGRRLEARRFERLQRFTWRQAISDLRRFLIDLFELDLGPWERKGAAAGQARAGLWEQLMSDPVGRRHPVTWREYHRPGGDLRYWLVTAFCGLFFLGIMTGAEGDDWEAVAPFVMGLVCAALCWRLGGAAMRFEEPRTLSLLLISDLDASDILRRKLEACYVAFIPALLVAEVAVVTSFADDLPRLDPHLGALSLVLVISGVGYLAGLVCYPLGLFTSRQTAKVLLGAILLMDLGAVIHLYGGISMSVPRLLAALAIPLAGWAYLTMLGRGWRSLAGAAMLAAASPGLVAMANILADDFRMEFDPVEWGSALLVPLGAINLAALGLYLSLKWRRNLAWLVALIGMPVVLLALPAYDSYYPYPADHWPLMTMLIVNLAGGPVLWHLLYRAFPRLVERQADPG